MTSGLSLPVLANDPPKKSAVKEEPPKPKFDYVDEEGEVGRSGYVYKHVAKPKFEEPKELPKGEAKEAHKPEPKDEHGKAADPHAKKDDGHGEHKKEEKKKDDGHDAHGEPKKEEKKKDDGHGDPKKDAKKGDDGHGGGHGGGHGKETKKVEPTVSTVYDSAVIKLDGANRPLTPVVQTNVYADYFLCRKTISTKYRDTILAEMNTFADRMGLPRAQELPCMIKVAKPNTKFPGAVFVEFYIDEKSALQCLRTSECGSTRLVMLYPKDKTGIKSKEIYRSYVLTDDKKFRRANFCVSPDGHLLGEKNCYVALNPDWLFN